MNNFASSTDLMVHVVEKLGISVFSMIGIIVSLVLALCAVYYGIKHIDMSLRIGGFYLLKVPYKGYKRFKSQSWNMEHTMQ